jgi:hypothetical protein
MSFSAITTKTPFLSSPLISLYYESINGVSCTRTDMFIYRDCFADMLAELADMPIKLADMPVKLADISIEVK